MTMIVNNPTDSDNPALADEVVQQIKNNVPPVAGGDDEDGKMVSKRPGKPGRKTR